jgi:hypothetical protein
MMRRFEVIPQTLPKNGTGDVLASISNFELEQNYPNPFNPTTNIRFSVAEDGFVSLKVFDVLGREVKNLLNQEVAAGRYDISFDASDLTSGTYIYQLSADNRIESKKMLLMK